MKFNDLQHHLLHPGQTALNLVKHGQNQPIRFGLQSVRGFTINLKKGGLRIVCARILE
jgi:hypothetical protein